MTKPTIYNTFEISKNNISNIWDSYLTVFNEEFHNAYTKKDALKTNHLLWILSDLHQLIRLQNTQHKIPLPNNNLKLMRLRGELCDSVLTLCSTLISFNSINSKNYTNQMEWFLEILKEQEIFYCGQNTTRETFNASRKQLKKLRQYENTFNCLHTKRFIDDCLKHAESADNKSVYLKTWKTFLNIKNQIIPVINSQYLPIKEEDGYLKGYSTVTKKYKKLEDLLFRHPQNQTPNKHNLILQNNRE